jgi:hypothetical protein
MAKVRIVLTLQPGSPGSPEFCDWCRARVAALMGRWPAVGLVSVSTASRRLIVEAHVHPGVPALPGAVALATALRRDLQAATRLERWIARDAELWLAGFGVLTVEERDARCEMRDMARGRGSFPARSESALLAPQPGRTPGSGPHAQDPR